MRQALSVLLVMSVGCAASRDEALDPSAGTSEDALTVDPGSAIWVRQIGDVAPLTVAADPGAGAVVLASFHNFADLGGGRTVNSPGPNVLLARYDAFGSVQFAKGLPSTLFPMLVLGVDDQREILVAGDGAADWGCGGDDSLQVAKLSLDGTC